VTCLWVDFTNVELDSGHWAIRALFNSFPSIDLAYTAFFFGMSSPREDDRHVQEDLLARNSLNQSRQVGDIHFNVSLEHSCMLVE
jgi:hypothetical protein